MESKDALEILQEVLYLYILKKRKTHLQHDKLMSEFFDSVRLTMMELRDQGISFDNIKLKSESPTSSQQLVS